MRLFKKQKDKEQIADALDIESLRHMKILIVDDELAQTILLTKTLERGGFKTIRCITEVQDIAPTFRTYQPDILLLDWNLGRVKGSSIVSRIKELLTTDIFFPILIITGDSRPEVKFEVLSGGADDFISKPFAAAELILRVRNLLKIRDLDSHRHDQTEKLEALVKERTQELDQAYKEVIIRLGRAAEYRDDVTGGHVWHVASLTEKLALELGLSKHLAALMMRAARLHDVGKIAVPDGILNKPGPLTPAEYEIVKSHTTVGAELLSGGKSEIIQMAESIAFTHHERWDGQGYPRGLKAEAIPLEGRIVALADAFDSLTRDSAYKRACTMSEAITEVKFQQGQQFDPKVVDAFLHLVEKGEVSLNKPEKATLLDSRIFIS